MQSQLITSMLSPTRIFALIVLLLIQTLPISTQAQQETTVFVLPVALVSSLYQVNIEQILSDNYRLRLESTSQAQNFRWYFHSGVLPPGLKITPDGNIVGRPRLTRPDPYRFKVRVLDSSAGSDALTLIFQLTVAPSRIRLVSAKPPRLVPVASEATAPYGNAGSKIALSDRIAPIWKANHTKAETSGDMANVRIANSTNESITVRQQPSETGSARYTPASGNGNVTVTDTTLLHKASSATSNNAMTADGPSCPSCLPSNPPDEEKDFIIDARTGETRGKRKFGLRDNARIIVLEKNPFLYQYKVTFKDRVIVESAIAAFFEGWPLFVDALKAPKDEGKKAAEAIVEIAPPPPQCPQFDQQYGSQINEIDRLRADLLEATEALENTYTPQAKAYEQIAQNVEKDKKVLYDQNTSCLEVCKRATSIRTTLEQYKPDLDKLSKMIDDFKLDAQQLRRRVERLAEQVENDPKLSSKECQERIEELRLEELKTLAMGYVTTANDLDAGIKKMIAGKKTFDALVKTINDVFNSPTAFYQVYTRGEYNLPTDVDITLERKELKEEAKFVKVTDTVTINFGGTARFALGGGVVVSPLETINFKRVPAIVNGQQTTIVGQDESSNSRILPMLMLHGRFADGIGKVSGFHFSLGVTAKPTDSGTNVEFLIGPSVSFIEERLFFTFGGYAGRRKQLEGNLVPGQELPKEFSDDIPTSNHLVWKPGIALTYKFK